MQIAAIAVGLYIASRSLAAVFNEEYMAAKSAAMVACIAGLALALAALFDPSGLTLP